MLKGKAHFFWAGVLALPFSTVHAQSPQQIIQQVVDSERTANQNDHSNWIYLEEIHKPKEHTLQWVGATQQGNVPRVLEKDDQKLPEPRQHDLVQEFLHDPKAQKKQIAEANHDNQQVDDLLKLLPIAFIWTETGTTATNTSLHFEPAPNFHPPTREARVFSTMTGDLVVDNQQHRVGRMSGHLIHDVNFGGGLLGKLKERSSFSLQQDQVGPSLWQLTSFHVHLEGNALIFKSISLQQDDDRSRFQLETPTLTLDQAATLVMKEPEASSCRANSAEGGPASEAQCGDKQLTNATPLKP
jgi:hypothetical protein